MTPEERTAQIRNVLDRVAARLAEHWPEDGAHINQLEEFAERMGRDLQREVSKEVLQEDAARKDGCKTACPCGGVAKYKRRNGLDIVTLAGRLRVRRAYYICKACGKGHCPADERLGLGPSNTTPATQARLAFLSSLEPYVKVRHLVHQLGLPLQLDIKSTELVTQAVGARLGTSRPHAYGKAERVVAVGWDGVMVKTWNGFKEARVGVVYEPDWNAARTPEAEAGLRKEYFATSGSREGLVREVCERARARAGNTMVGVVCDGQALDWAELDPWLPNRVEILDIFHVLERVAEIAKAMHPGKQEAAAWRAEVKKSLLEAGPKGLLDDLARWEPDDEAGRELKRIQLAYFKRQEERMQYPDYLRRGFPIGSGAVEGACKHVVVDRFGGSGMRWKMATAEPVLRLRAAVLTHGSIDLRPFAGRAQALAQA